MRSRSPSSDILGPDSQGSPSAWKAPIGTFAFRRFRWDCSETDRRGRTALFWAAGGGSADACEALTEGRGGLRVDSRGGDGSTPLHWAAAGVEARRFGTGGHVDVSPRISFTPPRGCQASVAGEGSGFPERETGSPLR